MQPPDPELAALLRGSRRLTSKKPLIGQLNPTPDPLAGVPETGDLEVDSAAELDALQVAFRSRRKDEDARFRDATDSEFWFAVCFKTRAEKAAFLRNAGLIEHGDKYLDGAQVAETLGVAID